MENMYTDTSMYLLRQPFLLFATESFQKIEVMRYGISHFYTFQADGTAYDLAEVVPDGCVDIMFVRGRSRSYAIYVGTPLNAYRVDFCHYFEKGDTVFGVRFLQGNLTWMKNCSACELSGRFLCFSDVSGMGEMVERICDSLDFYERIQTFLKYYLPEYEEKNREASGSSVIMLYTLRSIIASGGNIKIQALAERAAYSVRHLNELFRTAYGLSPKEFERIVRFQNSLSIVERCSRISDAAIESGYYDQSHMLKEYKALLGISPNEYLRRRKITELNQTLHIERMPLSANPIG